MNDTVQFFGGILIYLMLIMGTLISTMLLIVQIGFPWGLLVFLTWPFIATFIVWFVMWWEGL